MTSVIGFGSVSLQRLSTVIIYLHFKPLDKLTTTRFRQIDFSVHHVFSIPMEEVHHSEWPVQSLCARPQASNSRSPALPLVFMQVDPCATVF